MKIRIKPVHYQRSRGWDFAPHIESWEIYGKPSYDYKRYYSLSMGLNAFKYYAGINVQVTWLWGKK